MLFSDAVSQMKQSARFQIASGGSVFEVFLFIGMPAWRWRRCFWSIPIRRYAREISETDLDTPSRPLYQSTFNPNYGIKSLKIEGKAKLRKKDAGARPWKRISWDYFVWQMIFWKRRRRRGKKANRGRKEEEKTDEKSGLRNSHNSADVSGISMPKF